MSKDHQEGKKFLSAALPILAVEETAPCLAKAVVNRNEGMINKHAVNILIDSGSSESFINKKLANSLNITITPSLGVISMTSLSLSSKVEGNCYVDLQINNHEYKNIGISVE